MKTLFRPNQILKARELGARLLYDKTNEYDWLKRNAFAYPKEDAVIDTLYGIEPENRRRKTWTKAFEEVNLLIYNLMDRGLTKGDTLIVQLPNCIEHWYSCMAASKLGCWHLSNYVDYGPAETLQILEHVEPDIAIIVPSWHGRDIVGWYKKYQEQHPGLKHIFVVGDTVPEETVSFSELLSPKVKELYTPEDLDALKMGIYDPWMVFQTSGTTGLPKMVVHGSYWFHIHDACVSERFNFTNYDRCLVFGPMSGTTGKRHAVAFTLYAGATTLLLTEYSDEDACRITEEEKVTMWVGIPTLPERAFSGPFAEKYDLGTVRTMALSGAPTSVEIASKMMDMGIKVMGAYGASETGAVTCLSHLQTREEALYSVGKVIEGYDLAIVDEMGNELPQGETGEVYIWAVHHGFYKQPELEKVAYVQEGKWKGYHRSGDLGCIDEKGNLRIVGRSKDMILRGAQNIFPKEIEDILIGHPKIHQVAIVKMPDPVLHERACAFVVAKPGEHFTFEEMIYFLESQGLAKIKYPERLEIIDEMSMTVGGKVAKANLEERIAKKVEEKKGN